jgi:hypothetical protein
VDHIEIETVYSNLQGDTEIPSRGSRKEGFKFNESD